jgi:hypothetical protein
VPVLHRVPGRPGEPVAGQARIPARAGPGQRPARGRVGQLLHVQQRGEKLRPGRRGAGREPRHGAGRVHPAGGGVGPDESHPLFLWPGVATWAGTSTGGKRPSPWPRPPCGQGVRAGMVVDVETGHGCYRTDLEILLTVYRACVPDRRGNRPARRPLAPPGPARAGPQPSAILVDCPRPGFGGAHPLRAGVAGSTGRGVVPLPGRAPAPGEEGVRRGSPVQFGGVYRGGPGPVRRPARHERRFDRPGGPLVHPG